jgi:hypothetical protein
MPPSQPQSNGIFFQIARELLAITHLRTRVLYVCLSRQVATLVNAIDDALLECCITAGDLDLVIGKSASGTNAGDRVH